MPTQRQSLKIFIIGTGRSGTHWLGEILAEHQDMIVTVEKDPLFSWVTRIAVDPGSREKLLDRVFQAYQREHDFAKPKHYVDKSHPVIWIAEDLAAEFPDALFVAIRRSPYGTVASMLRHQGVMNWIHNWRRLPVPNPFLGISKDLKLRYGDLSLPARCALRWKSHDAKLSLLKESFGDRLLVVQYEDLHIQTGTALRRLERFLRLESSIPLPAKKSNSLDKWRGELRENDVAEIDHILSDEFPMDWIRAQLQKRISR